MSERDEACVLYEVRGALATVTLNRPHRRNAIAGTMLRDLNRALHRAAEDPAIRVLILRGAGSDFCPGADLNATAAGDATSGGPLTPDDFVAPVLLHEMPAVTIAAIRGACAGAGLGWALGCDLRFAAPSARFNTAFLDVGVAGDMGGPWLLPRIVGPAKARELYFLPGKFSAEEALKVGLVSRLYPDAQFDKEIDAIAERLSGAAPLALKAMKANFLAGEQLSLRDFIAVESRRHIDLFKTEDTREAFRAVVEKRPPRFMGR